MKSRRELQREIDELRSEREGISTILRRGDLTPTERVVCLVAIEMMYENGRKVSLDDLAVAVGLPPDVVDEALDWCSSTEQAS